MVHPILNFTLPSSMSSTPGQIILSGIVVLANARAVDPSKGNRNIAFDVNLPVDDGVNHQTLGLLRYFAPESRIGELEKVWQASFTEAFVISKVCTHPSLSVIPFHLCVIGSLQIATMPNSGIPPELIPEEDLFGYAFIGDITDVISSYSFLYLLHPSLTTHFRSS